MKVGDKFKVALLADIDSFILALSEEQKAEMLVALAPKPIHKVGDRCTIQGEEYILASTGAGTITAVCLNDGLRWQSLDVGNIYNITHNEYKQLTGE